VTAATTSRLEAGVDELADRVGLRLLDLRLVLHVLLKERDVAVVVPELGAGGTSTIVASEPAALRHSGRIVPSANRRRACA
jgi:hypothetical protein